MNLAHIIMDITKNPSSDVEIVGCNSKTRITNSFTPAQKSRNWEFYLVSWCQRRKSGAIIVQRQKLRGKYGNGSVKASITVEFSIFHRSSN